MNEQRSKVVIAIPAFNSAKTVRETLESVQAQREALRWVSAIYLADDCSNDGTIDIARASWRTPLRLRVVRGERNLGPYGNTNRIFSAVQGSAEWVFILHSDDIARDDWLDTMVPVVKGCSEDVATVCASWDTLRSDGSVATGEDDPTRPPEVIEGNLQAVQATLMRGCWWHVSGCAIRLRAFEDIGGFDAELPYSGDWEWLLRCLRKGWSVAYVPRTLTGYRQHDASISSLSFGRDRDISENLSVVSRYSWALSRSELTWLHMRLARAAIRRMVRALVRCNFLRCIRRTRTLALIGAAYVRCLRFRGIA